MVPEDPALSRPTMADVARALGARMLHGSPDSLQRDIGHVRVAAMELSHFLARLEPGGLLAVTRWLQVPPRDSLKLFATVIEALRAAGYGVGICTNKPEGLFTATKVSSR